MGIILGSIRNRTRFGSTTPLAFAHSRGFTALYEIFSRVEFRSPQKPRIISIRHGGTCGSKSFGQKSSFSVFTAHGRFGRPRTGTRRTSRRIAPTGGGLGAADPLEGLFFGQICCAVRISALPRRSKHRVRAKFGKNVYMGRQNWGRTVLRT